MLNERVSHEGRAVVDTYILFERELDNKRGAQIDRRAFLLSELIIV